MTRESVMKEVFDEQQRLTVAFLERVCPPNALANQANRGRFTSIEKIVDFIDIKKPAVVCGAGPSLADALPLIRRVRDRVVVYCVDVALPVLVDAGIIPDLIVNLDPEGFLLERSFGCVDRIPEGSRIALVCPTHAHPRVLEMWTGKIYAFNLYTCPTIEAIAAIGRTYPDIRCVASCPNVGHFTVNLAFTARHHRIAWAGLDYCSKFDGRTHAEGVQLDAGVVQDGQTALLAVDNIGKPVGTSANYCVQVETFVEYFLQFYHFFDCYNLSRGILPFTDDRREFERMIDEERAMEWGHV